MVQCILSAGIYTYLAIAMLLVLLLTITGGWYRRASNQVVVYGMIFGFVPFIILLILAPYGIQAFGCEASLV